MPKSCFPISLSPTNQTTANLYKKIENHKKINHFDHELMLVKVADKSLIIITGYSHHGIVEMVKLTLDLFTGKFIQY